MILFRVFQVEKSPLLRGVPWVCAAGPRLPGPALFPKRPSGGIKLPTTGSATRYVNHWTIEPAPCVLLLDRKWGGWGIPLFLSLWDFSALNSPPSPQEISWDFSEFSTQLFFLSERNGQELLGFLHRKSFFFLCMIHQKKINKYKGNARLCGMIRISGY